MLGHAKTFTFDSPWWCTCI